MKQYKSTPKKILAYQNKTNSTDRAETKTKARKAARITHIAEIQKHIPDCKKIMCLGCRSLHELEDFEEAGYDVIGIDVVPAKSKNTLQLDAHVMDQHFKENEFDFIYASHSMEHMHDTTKVLKAIRKIAKSGCMVILPCYGKSIKKHHIPSLDHPSLFNICLSNPTTFERVSKRDLLEFAELLPYIIDYYRHVPHRKSIRYTNQCELLFTWREV